VHMYTSILRSRMPQPRCSAWAEPSHSRDSPSVMPWGHLCPASAPAKTYRRWCAAEPMQLSAFPLVFGGRSIYGSLAGTAIETEDALAFSVLENIRPMIETVPLERAAEATIA